MEITFVNPGVDYMIERIMAFQTEDESAFWSEPLYHFYPSLIKSMPQACLFQNGKRILSERCGLFILIWKIR